ncbi:MAG: heavy metal translocating P-type ATPase [Candidatus Syntrophosphaera sp.]
MTEREFDVKNLSCTACGNKIECQIRDMPGVRNAEFDYSRKKLIVKYHSEVDVPLSRLNQIATSIEPGVRISHIGEEQPAKLFNLHWLAIGMGVLLFVAVIFLDPPLRVWIAVAAYILVAHRVLAQAAREVFSLRILSEHFLMGIASLGAMILGEYLEAGAVMVLYEIGHELEHRAVEHSRRSVKGRLALKPDTARLKTGSGTEDKPLGEIKKGDTIVIHPGERIPLDGVISKGESSVDTSTLTGEAEPLYVAEGTDVYAGFLNNGGLIELNVRSEDSESTITRVMDMIENAGARKSRQEKFITRFARVYTPVVVGIALLVFLVPVLVGQPADVWFKRALVFLIVSCPCALVISIPLTYFSGIGTAARRGIIFKGSAFMDILRDVGTVVFDKTGTLTTGEMKVEKIILREGVSPEEMMDTLYKSEHASSHPFARAIKAVYETEFDSAKVEAYSEYPGKGILVKYDGNRLIAGSESFIREFGFVDTLQPEGLSAVHAVKNNIYLGCVTFSDELRPKMAEAVSKLKKQGVQRTIMLSGDRRAKAKMVSRELGLDEYHAELLPEQKLEKLEAIIKASSRKVAYIGDGMNDAPALALADAGIAMGSIGNPSSIETADVVLLNDSPSQLVDVFSLSRRTGDLARQNIAIALGVKIAVMVFGIIGLTGLWEAVIADVGVTLLVIFNSLRLLRHPHGA